MTTRAKPRPRIPESVHSTNGPNGLDAVAESLFSELAPERNLDDRIPQIAKDRRAISLIEQSIVSIPTSHRLVLGNALQASKLPRDSVHLIVTSPPYWTLKKYNTISGQLGHEPDYDVFVSSLEQIWANCYDALVPGGRLVINVGDVCLSRKQNKGRHTVVPLHASIQESCRKLGFDNLSPIIWHKIANAQYEADGAGGGFLGKPYEPNAVIKNDIEYVLLQRKPGGYRSPGKSERLLSIISNDSHQQWFRQIWSDITGASTSKHPAPYPLAFAERLIRMFSFVGDTVVDPFAGTGTTSLAAAKWGRNSVSIELDEKYFKIMQDRMHTYAAGIYVKCNVEFGI